MQVRLRDQFPREEGGLCWQTFAPHALCSRSCIVFRDPIPNPQLSTDNNPSIRIPRLFDITYAPMSSPIDSLEQQSDAEDALLILDHEKLQVSNQKQWIPPKKSSLIVIIASTAIFSTLLSGFILHLLHILKTHQPCGSSAPIPGASFGSCGNTTSSALLANCTFDVMSFSWLPLPCSDPELTAEFLNLREWSWWLDESATIVLPFEKVATGEYAAVYVTREYHMYHCTYMWRKLHRGVLKAQENAEKRGIVDDYIGAYQHTSHCEKMLVGQEGDQSVVDKTVIDTQILSKFPRCMWT